MTEVEIRTKTYADPEEFHDVHLLLQIKLFARAPLFDTYTLDEDDFCGRCATKRYLLGDITPRALTTFAWRAYTSSADMDLAVDPERTLQVRHAKFSSIVLKSLSKNF